MHLLNMLDTRARYSEKSENFTPSVDWSAHREKDEQPAVYRPNSEEEKNTQL